MRGYSKSHLADERLSTFPAFFRVEGKSVAVFGNGDEAFA
jgi:uroporphyrin-III C-methyltransferase/precorrin-2 dehydrogenase/sirohydrochlorin ferrochelatase